MWRAWIKHATFRSSV
ncbi:hypothetical protein LINPERHAP1_LOCUS6988 [Linum perenne]